MPETFGSGTAGCSLANGEAPATFIADFVSSGDTLPLVVGADIYAQVVTAVDVQSGGGGSGDHGYLSLQIGAGTPVPFCVFNYGADQDSFSWRGWIVVGSGNELQFSTFGQDAQVVASGFVTRALIT